MKYFLLLFVANGLNAMNMIQTEAKDKGSKYLLVKIEDKKETVKFKDGKRLKYKGFALKDLLFVVPSCWSLALFLVLSCLSLVHSP